MVHVRSVPELSVSTQTPVVSTPGLQPWIKSYASLAKHRQDKPAVNTKASTSATMAKLKMY